MIEIDGAEIEVVGWDKYNPRKETTRPSWFRLENNLATGPGFFGIDAEQKWLWVVILSLVSQKNGKPITWSTKYVEAICGISEKKQCQTIEIFEKFGRLHVTRADTARDSCPTNERTNERTSSISSMARIEYPPGFEEIYNQYPRKQGKKNAYKKYTKTVNNEKDRLDLILAIQNYIPTVSDPTYFEHFDTFMGHWEDFLDPNVGTILAPAKKKLVIDFGSSD